MRGWGLSHLEEGGEGTSGGDEADRGDGGTSTAGGGGGGGTSGGLGGGRAGRVSLLGGGLARGGGRGRGTGAGGTSVGRARRAGGGGGGATTSRGGRGAGRSTGGARGGTTGSGRVTRLGGAVRATVADSDGGGVLHGTRAVLDLDGDGLASRNLSDLPGKRVGLGRGPGLEGLAAGVTTLDDGDVVGSLAAGPGEESRLALGESDENSLCERSTSDTNSGEARGGGDDGTIVLGDDGDGGEERDESGVEHCG